ncbi:MAG: hypothetical protein O3B95_02850 [Chloroflexi bacterium]|nr:hypothetical protein [Chloroflexota bacterium]
MDAEIVTLRLLHIVPGVAWVGSAIFLAFVLQPALAKTGPPHSRAVMRNAVKRLLILLHSSAWLTMIVGVIMAFRVRDPLFDFLWSTPWGTMIWLGFVFAVIGYAIGTIGGLTSKKMMDLGASLAGQPPTPQQAGQIANLQKRGMLLSKIAAVLVTAAVVVMALAQHV